MLTEPVALAPEAGREQAVGEVSGAAEAFGIRAGMALSEALGRCPRLALVPPDPGRAAREWERVLQGLEGIGAAVESDRIGEAYFEVDGLRGIWGPSRENVLIRAGRAIGRPARIAGAPTRFCAFAAASTARPLGAGRRTPRVIGSGERARLPRPAAGLSARRAADSVGGRRAGARARRDARAARGRARSASWPACRGSPIADRFGALGLRAHELASGIDTPLRPRLPHEELIQAIGLPEAAYGTQLERALELLIERLARRPAPRGPRDPLAAAGGAPRRRRLLERRRRAAQRLRPRPSGCGWRSARKLGGLTAPATDLALRALELAPGGGIQPALDPDPAERRRERLAEAVRQVRAAAGRDSVLRVLEVDPGSRVPERWAMLAPVNETGRSATRSASTAAASAASTRPARARSSVGPAAQPRARRRRARREHPRGVAGRGPLVDERCPCAATTSSVVTRRAARCTESVFQRPLRRAGRSSPTSLAADEPLSVRRRLRRAPRPLRLLVPRRRLQPRRAGLAAAELGYGALALTDHDGLWGSMEFAQACRTGDPADHRGRADRAATTGRPSPAPRLPRQLPARRLPPDAAGRDGRRLPQPLPAADDRPRRHARRPRPTRRRRRCRWASSMPPLRGARLPLRLRPRRRARRADRPRRHRAAPSGSAGGCAAVFGPERFRVELQRPLLARRPGPQPAARAARRRARRPLRRDRQRPLPTIARGCRCRTRSSRSAMLGTLESTEPERRGNGSSALVEPARQAERFAEHPEAVAESRPAGRAAALRPDPRPRLPLPRLRGRERRPPAGRDLPGPLRRALRRHPAAARGRAAARGGAAA